MDRILIIEDEIGYYNKMRLILVNLGGFAVDRAKSLKEAKDKFTEGKYCILLVDIKLESNNPDNIDGLEFIKQIKSEYKDIPPIMVFTANYAGSIEAEDIGKIYYSKIAENHGIKPSNFRNKEAFNNPEVIVNAIKDEIRKHRLKPEVEYQKTEFLNNETIFIKEDGKDLKRQIDAKDILYIKSNNKENKSYQCLFYIKEEEQPTIVNGNLKKFEDLFKTKKFSYLFRCAKGTIANTKHIKKTDATSKILFFEKRDAKKEGYEQISVGDKYWEELIKIFPSLGK